MTGPSRGPQNMQKSQGCTVVKPDLFAVPGWEARGFVERPGKARAVLDRLLAGNGGAVGITGLKGAGGFGKTQLALWLCHQPEVWEAFPDGILWVTLGEEPTPAVSLLDDIITHLTGRRPGFHDLSQARAAFNAALADQRILLVIDDVWKLTDLEPLSTGGSQCVRLITTRFMDRLPRNAACVTMEEMESTEAVELLTQGLKISRQDSTWHHLASERLGRWPLLLSLVNAHLIHDVGEGLAVENALARVEKDLTEDGLNACNQDDQTRHLCVNACLQASLGRLPPLVVPLFSDLAIFPEDVNIPLMVLEKLWHPISAVETRRTCRTLKNFSLLQNYDLSQNTIRLHDVFRTWLREKPREGDDSLERINGRFVDSFGFTGEWHKMPADGGYGYLWEKLAWHLQEAGRSQDVLNLAKNLVWLGRKSRIVGVLATEADVIIARQLFPQDQQLELLERRLRACIHLLAACQDEPEAIAVLHGRLRLEEGLAPLVAGLEKSPFRPPVLIPFHHLPDGPDPALERIFFGHTDPVTACIFSQDDRLMLSASRDKTVRLWNVATGEEVRVFKGHLDQVFCLALSPDGRLVLSGSWDRTVRLWEIASGKEVGVYAGHPFWDHCLALSPDGQLAVSASDEVDTLCLWEIATGKIIRIFGEGLYTVRCAAISHDGQLIALASGGNTIHLWDVATGQECRIFTGHSDVVEAVAFSPDRQWVISSSHDHTVRLWEVATGNEIRVFAGHSNVIRGVAFSHDGRFIISASDDKTIRLWEIAKDMDTYNFIGFRKPVFDVAFCSEDQLVLLASHDGILQSWDVVTDKEVHVFASNSCLVNSIAVSPDGRLALSASHDNSVCLWEVATGKEVRTFVGHSGDVRDVVFSPNGKLALFASRNDMCLWEVETGKKVLTSFAESGGANSVAFIPGGEFIISLYRTSSMQLWEVATGNQVMAFGEDAFFEGGGMALSPNGELVLSGLESNDLCLWRIATGEKIGIFNGHCDQISSIAFNPNGQLAISASWDKTLRLWDLASSTCLAVFHADDEMNCCAFHPDGRRIVAGGNRGLYFLEIHGLPSHPHLEQTP